MHLDRGTLVTVEENIKYAQSYQTVFPGITKDTSKMLQPL